MLRFEKGFVQRGASDIDPYPGGEAGLAEVAREALVTAFRISQRGHICRSGLQPGRSFGLPFTSVSVLPEVTPPAAQLLPKAFGLTCGAAGSAQGRGCGRGAEGGA